MKIGKDILAHLFRVHKGAPHVHALHRADGCLGDDHPLFLVCQLKNHGNESARLQLTGPGQGKTDPALGKVSQADQSAQAAVVHYSVHPLNGHCLALKLAGIEHHQKGFATGAEYGSHTIVLIWGMKIQIVNMAALGTSNGSVRALGC